MEKYFQVKPTSSRLKGEKRGQPGGFLNIARAEFCTSKIFQSGCSYMSAPPLYS